MLEAKTQDLMANADALLPLIVSNALNALGAIVILAHRAMALGQSRSARGQDAQSDAAFRPYAEKLLRQPCAL
jgi:hypothetical protein